MLQSKLMKSRATTPAFKGIVTKSTLVAAAVVMAFSAPMAIMPNAFARDYNAEMQAIDRQIGQYQAEAARLSNEAQTLANELAKLASEKATIQASIDRSQTRFDKLSADIKANEIKIADNKDALGVTLADMYVDTSISPLEMLASSNNVGDYVDKQSYRSSVNDQLKVTIDTIAKLKKELETQKHDVELVIADQKTQRAALSAKEAERQDLMNKTKGEEAAYQVLSAEGRAKKQKIVDEQAAYFASLQSSGSGGTGITAGDPNKGGYPYTGVGYYSYTSDPWGMYIKQCVSYTAWKVYQKNGYMPAWGGKGNAWQWAFSGYHDGTGNKVNYATSYYHTSNAAVANIPNGSEPRVGSVAVRDANPGAGDQWGHVAWVEKVSGDQIYISQYNYNTGSGPGQYSEMWISKSFFQAYIYF